MYVSHENVQNSVWTKWLIVLVDEMTIIPDKLNEEVTEVTRWNMSVKHASAPVIYIF